MKAKLEDIAKLARLTETAFQVAQSKLRKKAEAEARLQAEIDQVEETRAHVLQNMTLNEGRSAAQITCDAAYLTWAERRRMGLNMALAQARAAALQEREATRKAFGKDQVAQTLHDRAASSAHRKPRSSD